MPAETKLASVGSQTADKPEIIAWAAALYPEAPWLRYQKDAIRGKKKRKAGICTTTTSTLRMHVRLFMQAFELPNSGRRLHC
jgi:hypothetical protein